MWWDFIAGLCLAGVCVGGRGEELVSLAAPEGRALSCGWVGGGECRWKWAGWEGRLPRTWGFCLGGGGGSWGVAGWGVSCLLFPAQ